MSNIMDELAGFIFSESKFEVESLVNHSFTRNWKGYDFRVIDKRDNTGIPLDRSEFTFWEILSFGKLDIFSRNKIELEIRLMPFNFVAFRSTLGAVCIAHSLRGGY